MPQFMSILARDFRVKRKQHNMKKGKKRQNTYPEFHHNSSNDQKGQSLLMVYSSDHDYIDDAALEEILEILWINVFLDNMMKPKILKQKIKMSSCLELVKPTVKFLLLLDIQCQRGANPNMFDFFRCSPIISKLDTKQRL